MYMINKMVLWTVQFWLSYWISNISWKPSIESVNWVLDRAISSWINIFDTAPAYWDSEEIIGWYIKKNNLKWKIKIISKFSWLNSSNNTSDLLRISIENSINVLWVDYLDGYLLHNAKDFYNLEIIDSILKTKSEWLIKNIWVSIYEIDDALAVSENQSINYIQIPFNILDQRLNKTDFFINCKRNWIKIFARSPFLQWLLLMEEKNIPSNLSWVIPYLEKFDNIIWKYWLTRQEACIHYVLQNSNIDYFLFWVDNINQLNQNLEIAKKSIDFSQWIIEIEEYFINVEKKIISPNLWNN